VSLRPSASKQLALDKLLAAQQNPRSKEYHRWLTPEQYAGRFGATAGDFERIVTWLQSEGFTIVQRARGRNWVAFSGTAAQVRTALRTEIHNYSVNGESHFANAN
jgi:subtilase family serine protease